MKSRISNADADQLTEHYKKTLSPTIVEPLGARGRISVEDSHFALDSAAIWDGACHSGMEVTFIEPPQLFIIYLPSCGAIDINVGSKKQTLGPDIGFIGDFSTLEQIRFHPGRSHTGIAIDKAFMVRQLSEFLDAPVTKRLEFSPTLEPGSAVFCRLSAMSTLLWGSLRENPENVASLKYVELLFQAIAAYTLDHVPHNYSEKIRGMQPSALPRHVKKATDYMVAHAGQPLTIGEIAREAGVSVRSLQTGFQQFKGTTPLHHLRTIRLDRAREALLRASDDSSIHDIARQCGFNHLGRFAALYNEAFGEFPFETRRSKADRKRNKTDPI
jgi:AraC-like DNA-binding protein